MARPPTRPAFAVPAGNPFVPCDNRDNAIDSGHQSPNDGGGVVPLQRVVAGHITTPGGAGA